MTHQEEGNQENLETIAAPRSSDLAGKRGHAHCKVLAKASSRSWSGMVAGGGGGMLAELQEYLVFVVDMRVAVGSEGWWW